MSHLPADSTESEAPIAPPPFAALWGVRVLGGAALAISVYLARLAHTGQTAAGCGREGGLDCERVLSSRWSYWIALNDYDIYLLVSDAAAYLWVTILAVTVFAGASDLPGVRRLAWLLLTVLTTAAAGAAAWFIGVQAVMLRHWCLYCLAAHACGILAWVVVVRVQELAPRAKLAALGLGLVAATMVPLGQFRFPREAYYLLDRVEESTTENPLVIESVGSSSVASDTRRVEVLGGGAQIDVTHLPRIGDADSPYVVVLLYDYACWHCRELHRELLRAQQEYQGRLTVVLLPTPLSHHCNKSISEENSTSPDACGLARLALIVWELKPEAFAEFDAWLFAPPKARTLDEARAQAASLVGAEALAAAEKDTRFDALLQKHIELYERSPADLIPQIMGRHVILSAGVESAGELLEALEHEFGFQRP